MSASRNADRLDRKLFPYTQKRLELDGHELAYVDEGKGPPLLMLHGNPTWSFLYRDVIAGLRERFRCIAPICRASASPPPPPALAFAPPSTHR
jgi:haloalkane dehalogenase